MMGLMAGDAAFERRNRGAGPVAMGAGGRRFGTAVGGP
jgi:hypothetical protein